MQRKGPRKGRTKAHGYFFAPFTASAENETEFERIVRLAGLEGKESLWPTEPRIRRFVEDYRNQRYVPEWLLDALGQAVKADDF